MGDGSEDEEHSGGKLDVAVEEGHPELSEPPRFAVLLINDDYTTMEFVVEVLQKFFKKNEAEAMKIMLAVHRQGRGVAGIYTFDIAETKVQQVNDYARSHGFPLKAEVEPQGTYDRSQGGTGS